MSKGASSLTTFFGNYSLTSSDLLPFSFWIIQMLNKYTLSYNMFNSSSLVSNLNFPHFLSLLLECPREATNTILNLLHYHPWVCSTGSLLVNSIEGARMWPNYSFRILISDQFYRSIKELKVVYLMFRSCACQNQLNESMWCFCA